MQRVDGAYLYELGATLRPVANLGEEDVTSLTIFFALSPLRDTIGQFISGSVFSGSLRTVINSANELLREINALLPEIANDTDWSEIIPSWRISHLKGVFKRFEAVLVAELQTFALYHVAPKGGLDTLSLTDRGSALFPLSLSQKAPEAVEDVVVGARCMAFELWTAMAFHFHRANEAVMRRYYSSVIGMHKQPKFLTIGSMIASMRQHSVGDLNIIAALDNIREFHRNPISHPEQRLDTQEQAISLYAAIRAAIGYMLDKLPLSITNSEESDVPPLILAPEDNSEEAGG